MSGLDLVIKSYYDRYRSKGELPPIIAQKIPGKLYRDVPPWLAMGEPALSAKLVGKLDELLEPEPGLVAPIDHKSRGTKPNDIHPAYQLQMDVYDLLLSASGYRTPHKAWLVYYIPQLMNHEQFTFDVDVQEIPTNPERARDLFFAAVKVARGSEPPHNTECEFCRWWQVRNKEGVPDDPPASDEDVPF